MIRRAILYVLPPLAAVAIASSAMAQEGCSASCTCPCRPDAEQCTVLVCNAPSVASCHDGSCGAGAAKCCCSTPGQPGRGCVPYDCGDWPLYQCAKSAAPTAPTANGTSHARLQGQAAGSPGSPMRRVGSSAGEATPELCRALRQMNPEDDLWSYAELASATKGGARRYQIRFASDPDYATGLQRCADLGLAFDEDQEASDKPEFLFRFRAPRGSVSPTGLHPALQVPDGALGPLSGVLAIQLRMTSAGQILSKRLLFATDARLGEAALLGIDRWFSVIPGTDLATFEDVLFLKFEAGRLGMAVEHHHANGSTAA
jgi:hypothetical protein